MLAIFTKKITFKTILVHIYTRLHEEAGRGLNSGRERGQDEGGTMGGTEGAIV